MSTIIDSYITGIDSSQVISDADVHEAQTITYASDYIIYGIVLKLYRVATAGDINVSIRNTNIAGEPIIGNLASGTTDGDTLTTVAAGEERIITFITPYTLIADTKYAIVVNIPGASVADYVMWKYDTAGATYAGGDFVHSADGLDDSWTIHAGKDFYFKTFGVGVSGDLSFTAPADKTYSKELVAICNNEVWRELVENGTATGGTPTTLLDSTRTEAEDYFNDWRLTIVSGTGISETATVTNYISASGTFAFTALSGGSTPDTTSRYTVDKMSAIAAAHNELDTTDVLNAAVSSQKLFIINGTIKKVFDCVNVKIVTADISPGANLPPDFGTIITGASGAKMIVDYITAINGACTVYGKRTTTTTFTAGDTITGTNPTTSPYAGAVSFTMTAVAEVAGPHWYNYTVYGADATNYGAIPDKVYQVCRYRGRVQLTGDPNYPHQWYQSRQLNPFDFLYVAGDAQSPVAGNNADCTEVGDIVVVAIPYSDDFLVYGCANEIWVMSGDAAFGGELNPIDTTTGILGDRAWCWDDKGNLYMAGTAGLLRIPRGFGQIENLTRELWPDFINDLAFDSSLHRITLAFNPEEFGIHILKTTLATGACTGWWYDLRTEGLFPDAFPTAMGIYSAVYYQTESPSYRKLLVGCADGYIKSFDRSTVNDDGTAITSYVGFAPLSLSTHPRKDGIIKNIDIVTGIGDTDSSNVTCTVHVARTAAQIIKKLNDGDAAAFTKVFVAPNWTKSNLDRRSIRGQWAALVLTNSALAESWSMERLIVDSKEVGRSL